MTQHALHHYSARSNFATVSLLMTCCNVVPSLGMRPLACGEARGYPRCGAARLLLIVVVWGKVYFSSSWCGGRAWERGYPGSPPTRRRRKV